MAAVVFGCATGAHGQIIAVRFTGDEYSIDPNTGAGTLIGNVGFPDIEALSRDVNGRLVGAQQTIDVPHLIQVDPNGGPGAIIQLPFLNHMTGLAFVPGSDHILYASDVFTAATTNIYRLDLSVPFGDPAINTFVGTENSTSLTGMTFGPDGRLYAWSIGAGLGTVNLLTGAFTDVNPAVGGLNEIQDLTFGPDGTLYGGSNALYRIDTVTGAETLIGSGGYIGLGDFAYIPAPLSSGAFLLFGGCLGARRRRR
jgi:hypothetical protein